MSRNTTTRALLPWLVGVSVLGLLARAVALGTRPMHWDEARVAYWTLQYVERGAWSYHPIVHGPFLFHVNRWVFEHPGMADATARAVVALVGGLFPLSAGLFRSRLRDDEVLALAILLSVSPILLYYSRFLRNDLLVAAFAFVGLGLLVRAIDTGRARYLPAAGVAVGLAFTTKENAVLYLACWLGAAAIVLCASHWRVGWDWEGTWPRLATPSRTPGPEGRRVDGDGGTPPNLRRRGRDQETTPPCDLEAAGWTTAGRTAVDRIRGLGVRWWVAGIVALLCWFVVIVVFYAPRGTGGVTLETAIRTPSTLPTLVRVATLGSAEKLVALWLVGGARAIGPRTVLYAVHLVAILWIGAGAICLLAGYGLRETHRRRRPDGNGETEIVRVSRREAPGDSEGGRDDDTRTIVSFAALWAFLSLLGYPLAVDLAAPWTAVHVAVPLSIPAAVGLAALVGRLRRADAPDERGDGSASGDSARENRSRPLAVALVLLVAWTGTVGIVTSYAAPASAYNPLGQPAQPAGDIRETVHDLDAVACSDEPVVLYYGPYFAPEHAVRRFPLRWYVERAGLEREYAPALDGMPDDPPPVVVALTSHRSDLDARLPGYRARTHELDPWVPREPVAPLVETVVYVDPAATGACP